jgi:hypothetical protein
MLYDREPSIWTPEYIAKLCELWAAGKTTPEIGRLLGCSKNSVISAARRYGCAPRPSPLGKGRPPARQ